jgi:4-amino-4-deoxychorismate lyase
LLVVDSDTLDYSLKYSDRSPLEQLYSKREIHDDIIICRHGAITDSYYANLAFEKDGVWFTPDTPLLQGVKRTWLIQSGAIKEKEIYIEDLPDYSRICLFNAMIEFGELELPVGAIHIP